MRRWGLWNSSRATGMQEQPHSTTRSPGLRRWLWTRNPAVMQIGPAIQPDGGEPCTEGNEVWGYCAWRKSGDRRIGCCSGCTTSRVGYIAQPASRSGEDWYTVLPINFEHLPGVGKGG